jgi:hypothetical protein
VQEVTGLSGGLKALNQIHLPACAPEDYLDRGRAVLEERGGFSTIPGADASPVPPDADVLLGDATVDLRVRLRRAGLSQQDLARHLRVSAAFLSAVLSGKKPWPPGMRERAEEFLAADARLVRREGSSGASAVRP